MSSRGIIGPYVFEGRVDQWAYYNMIDFYFIIELKRKFELTHETWFQQDASLPYCTKCTLELDTVYFRVTNDNPNLFSLRSHFECQLDRLTEVL